MIGPDPGPFEPRPLTLPRHLRRAWSGRLILITRRASFPGPWRQVRLRLVHPAIVKYRELFSEVLAASFFLQLFALVTPLFFQVIIDKVLVHRGLTTLPCWRSVCSPSHSSRSSSVVCGPHLFRIRPTGSTCCCQAVRSSVAAAIVVFRGAAVAIRWRGCASWDIRNFPDRFRVDPVIDLFFTLVFFAVLYHYSPVLTAVVAGAVSPFYVPSVRVTPILRRA